MEEFAVILAITTSVIVNLVLKAVTAILPVYKFLYFYKDLYHTILQIPGKYLIKLNNTS
jgi:hypothetical protein